MSVYKLEHLGYGLHKDGSFNAPPSGLKEISEADFATSNFFNQAPANIEYRQMSVDKATGQFGNWSANSENISGFLYWMDEFTGYVISRNYTTAKVS